MKKTLYLFSNGQIKRKDNTIFFDNDDGSRKYLPIENVKEIFCFGEVTLNKKFLNYMSQKEILIHYFNYYEYYSGTFYPREHYNSGYMILKQAEYYNNPEKRKELAISFVEGASKNALKILKYYQRRGSEVLEKVNKIEDFLNILKEQKRVEQVMAIEGNIKNTYYEAFDDIINNKTFEFVERTRRPPKNRINALISFANSIIYTCCLGEIYQTHLDPRIGYLHTTNFRRFTLNLDVAEIFKPVIGDRTIFSIINKGILKANHFEKGLKGTVLNESGRKIFLKELENTFSRTIKHGNLKRKVSYRRLIRLELYKLEKHFMGEKDYKPFVMEY